MDDVFDCCLFSVKTPANLRAVSARTYDCPQCGAPVSFQSSITVFAVCSFCRSMVIRKDAGVERLGEMAELPPDLSPLQIGTRGEWQGETFELIGRVRVAYEEGSWTEWCAFFSQERIGWIAETQGFFMVTVLSRLREEVPADLKHQKAGHAFRLGGHSWRLSDVKQVVCLAVEGELPYAAPPGSRRVNADFTGTGTACGTIEFHDSQPEVYLGEYAEFEQLKLSNLRPVPGWTADVEQLRHQTNVLNCPNCGAAVELRAAGQTQSAVCGSCGTLIDTANPLLGVIKLGTQKVRDAMQQAAALISIGARGKIQGQEWELIGLQTRADQYCEWTEYLLFNPWHGFRWLVNFRGHWSFIRQIPGTPQILGGQKVRHNDRTFDLFAREKAETRVVLGEFYWKVRRGEVAHVSDYVHPPGILSLESYPELNEHTWSEGEYIEPKVIRDAFGLKKMPAPTGIYLNQPNPWAIRWNGIKGWALLFVALFVGVQFLFIAGGDRKPLWQGSFTFDRSAPVKMATTPTFRLNAQQPVAIKVFADVENNWIGFDAELVDAKTNLAYPVGVGVEYYHGIDGGESWSEGSKSSRVAIPAVPPGEYFVNLDPEADPAIQNMQYRVEIEPGGLFWSNFWIGLFLLLAYPILVLWRRHAWESERWSESDFSPYASSSSDD